MTNLMSTPALHDQAGCMESIKADHTFFKRMLDLIPPSINSDQQSQQTQEEDNDEEADVAEEKPSKEEKKKIKKHRKKEKMKFKRSLSTEQDDEDSELYTAMKKSKIDPVDIQEAPASVLTTPTNTNSLLSSSIADLDDKRAKLRAKILDFRAKRNLNDNDRLKKKKLKRQESKMKLKQKRKEEKNNTNKPNLVNGLSTPKGGNSIHKTPTKPIFNKEGQMVFSKFDFTDSSKKDKREKQSELTGKDYKRLLEKIEKRNQKIKKLKSKDEDAAKSLQDKFKWESVMNKAEGQKVKDNPELLKKALKKKEKMREKKKQKWDDRVKTVQKLQADKQKKRTENLNKRKQAVKDKKVQKLKKKGRLVPGF